MQAVKTKITIFFACVALALAAITVFRVNARPKHILVETVSALDDDLLTKRFDAARSRFTRKSGSFADTVSGAGWRRYCLSLGGYVPQFQDAYAMASNSGDTVFGAFKRKSISDLQYHYFLDVVLVKEKEAWKILQLKLPKREKPGK